MKHAKLGGWVFLEPVTTCAYDLLPTFVPSTSLQFLLNFIFVDICSQKTGDISGHEHQNGSCPDFVIFFKDFFLVLTMWKSFLG